MSERVDEKILDFLNQMERREEIRNICNGNLLKLEIDIMNLKKNAFLIIS